jgi:hypothetical protein
MHSSIQIGTVQVLHLKYKMTVSHSKFTHFQQMSSHLQIY